MVILESEASPPTHVDEPLDTGPRLKVLGSTAKSFPLKVSVMGVSKLQGTETHDSEQWRPNEDYVVNALV